MGAVLTLVVVVVGDIQIAIDVVVAEGGLAVDVKICSGEGLPAAGCPLIGIQLLHHRADFFGIQKLVGNPLFFGRLIQGIGKSGWAEGLMIRIQACINHGNSTASACVPLQPRLACAGHLARDCHIWAILAAHRNDLRLIAGFLYNGLHTIQGGNFLYGAARNIGRNHVGRKG